MKFRQLHQRRHRFGIGFGWAWLTFSVVACSVVPTDDNGPRRETSPEVLKPLKSVFISHMDEVGKCRDRSRAPNKVIGRIVLQGTITPEGKATEAGILKSEINDRKVEDCMVEKMRTWEFPRPRQGFVVVASFPYVFTSVGIVSGLKEDQIAPTSD